MKTQTLSKSLLLMAALLLQLGQLASATTCFSSSNFPKWFYPGGGSKTWTYSITFSEALNAIFSGGIEEVSNYPQFYRIDLDKNRVRWRRYLKTTTSQMVTAMAVNPTGDYLAVVVMDEGDRISISNTVRLLLVRTSDGGHHTNYFSYKFGDTNFGEHYIRDKGLVFAANGIVYMAAYQGSTNMRNAADNSFSDYAGRQIVAAWNPSTMSMEWVKEQPQWFGFSAALVYKNYGSGQANLFVGGSNDSTRLSNGDPKTWVLAVTRLTEAGESPVNGVFHINQKTSTTAEATAPYISHMHLDDTGALEILFGATLGRKNAFQGEYSHLWKVTLDATTHNPVPSTLFVSHCDPTQLHKKSLIVALKSTLVSGNVHGLWLKADKRLFYFVYDWTYSKMTTHMLNKLTQLVAFGVFGGTKTESNGGLTIYQGYYGVSSSSYDLKAGSGNKDTPVDAAAVISTLGQTEGCLKLETFKQDVDNIDTSATGSLSTSPTWQTNSLQGAGTTSVAAVEIHDAPYDAQYDDSWCSPAISSLTVGSGTVSQTAPLCTGYDNNYVSIDFSPNSATSGGVSCSDTAPTWIYQVDETPVAAAQDQVKLSVDSKLNKIWLKGITGGTTYGAFSITVNGFLPQSNQKASFTVQIYLNPCVGIQVTPPTLTDQLYYVTNPTASYTTAAFTTTTACAADLIYSTSSSPTKTWITSPTTRKIQWQTNDETQVSTYALTVTAVASNSCPKSASVSYNLVVQSACNVVALAIDSSSAVFLQPSMSQQVWQPATTLTWDDSKLTKAVAGIDCGVAQFAIVNQDGSTIDTAVFTATLPVVAGQTQKLVIQTNDSTKVKTYNLRVKAWYTKYTNNIAQKDFVVVIGNICETGTTLVAGSLSDTVYTIRSGSEQTSSFSSFLQSPTYCPMSYSMSVSPALPAADSGAIALNASARVYTFSSNNSALAGIYTVTTTCITPLGTATTTSFSFKVEFKDPCMPMTIDSGNTVLKTPALTQNVWQPAQSITWTDALVVTSNPSFDCGAVQFSIVNSDGSAIDSSVFTATLSNTKGSTQKLAVQTNVSAKAKTYNLLVKTTFVNYSSTSGSKAFTIVIADACETPTLTASSLSDAVYMIGTAASTTTQYAEFTKSPTYCPIGYAMSVSPALPAADTTAINFDAPNRSFTFSSTNPAIAKLYTVTVTGLTPLGTATTTSFSFKVEFKDPCMPMTIDSGNTVLKTPALTQNVWQPAQTITWTDALVVTSNPSFDCGAVQFSIVNSDGSAIDSSVFSATLSNTKGSTQTLAVQTNESAKAKTYNLLVKSTFVNYSATSGSKAFTIVIADPCETPTLTASSLSDSIYMIGTAASTTTQFAEFTKIPTYCPIGYAMSVSPALPAADTSAINFDAPNRSFTFTSTNPAIAKLYTVTVTGLTPLGTATTTSFSFKVEFKDPCMPMTIDSGNTVLKTPALTQNVWQPAQSITWTDALVVTSNPSFDCGAVQFSIVNSDGSAIDSSVFTATLSNTKGSTQKLAVQTNVSAKAKTYNLLVKTTFVNYSSTSGSKAFTIVIADACETPTLTASSLANDVYVIGSGSQNTVSFSSFLQTPTYCPVSYAMSVSPSLAASEASAIQLNLPQRTITFSSSSIALENTYTVKVTCLTPLGTDTGVKFEFTVEFKNPCRSATLTIDPTILTSTPYSYVIGATADVQTFLDSKVTSSFSGTVCPSDFVFTVTKRDGTAVDLSLFSWDASAQTFTTYTNSIGHYSTSPYQLTIHVAYQGYSVAGTLNFDVKVDLSCDSAVFDSFTVNAMTYSVLGTPSQQVLPAVKDSVSKVAGNLDGFDRCGPRIYSITTLPATLYNKVLSLNTATNTLTLGLATTGASDVNTYSITVQVALQNYPSVKTTASFTVQVTHCVVTSLTKTAVADQTYNLWSTKIQFSFSEFVQVPACQYTLNYSFKIKDTFGAYTNLPNFISESSRTFSVESIQFSDGGLYKLAVIAVVPSGYPTFSDELLINLAVVNACSPDVVTPTSAPISSFTYTMAKTGLLTWSPTWSSSVAGCPATFEIARIVNSALQALTTHETAALTFSRTNGSLQLLTNNFNLDKEVWTIKVFKKSTYATTAAGEGSYQFDITFKDPCWDSVLSAAVFSQSTYSFDMFQTINMPFSPMVDESQGLACGGYTYELEYEPTGPLFKSGSGPNISFFGVLTAVSGVVPSSSWVGTHPFRLKCTNGRANASATARGKAGLFNSVYSTQINLTIFDPCEKSVVNSDRAITMYVLRVSPGVDKETVSVAGPADSISTQYGNGYNKCGDLTYTLVGETTLTKKFLLFDPVINSGAVDKLDFTLESFAGNGNEIAYNMQMLVALKNYPASTSASIPVTFFYRECMPANFSFNLTRFAHQNTPTLELNVGDVVADIDVRTGQAPCTFGQVYEAKRANSVSTALPSFLTLTKDGLLQFSTIKASHEGKYDVFLRSTLLSQYQNEIKTMITIIVSVKPVTFTKPSRAPNFSIENLQITQGQPFSLTLDPIFNFEGQKMNITVDLGSASDFVVFDAAKSTISVVLSQFESTAEGLYTIKVAASYSDQVISESYSKSFQLAVFPPKEEEEEVVVELKPQPNVKFDRFGGVVNSTYHNIKESNYVKVESREPGERNPRQPIPHLKSLSPEGVLKIVWDLQLSKPEHLSELPLTYVVVAESEKDLNEKDERRRLKRTMEWFETEKEYLEYLLVMDALDIELIPCDEEAASSIHFSWDLLAYESQEIVIQLYFDYPGEMSEDGEFDEISVTFWGVEFFKSQEGEPVRFGERVSTKVPRQIDSETSSFVVGLTSFLMSALACFIGIVALMLLVTGDSLLSVWIFATSITLIVHSLVFRVVFPDTVAIVLSVMLKFLRLDFEPLEDYYYPHKLSFAETQGADVEPSLTFLTAGYESVRFNTNLRIVMKYMLVSPLLLMIPAILKDFATCKCRRKNEKNCLLASWARALWSMYIRIVFLLLLEVSICASLELKALMLDGHGYDSAESLTFVCASLSTGALLLILVAVFYCDSKRKGAVMAQDEKGEVEEGAERDEVSLHSDSAVIDNGVDDSRGGARDGGNNQINLEREKSTIEESMDVLDVNQGRMHDSASVLDSQHKSQNPLLTHSDANVTGGDSPRIKLPKAKKSIWERMEDLEVEVERAAEAKVNLSYSKKQERFNQNLSLVSEESQVIEDTPIKHLVKLRNQNSSSKKSNDFFEGGNSILAVADESDQIRQLVRKGFEKNQRTKAKAMTLSFRPVAVRNVALQLEYRTHPCLQPLFQGLWISRPAVLYTLIHVFRCFAFAVSTVFCEENPLVQVLVLALPTLLMISAVAGQRHHMWRDRTIFVQHIGNEITIYFASVLLLHLTLFVHDDSVRAIVGFFFLGLIAVNVVFNAVVFCVIIYRRWSLICSRCQARRQKVIPTQKVKISPNKIEPPESMSFSEQKLLQTSHHNYKSVGQGILSLLDAEDGSQDAENVSVDEVPHQRIQLKIVQDAVDLGDFISADEDVKGTPSIKDSSKFCDSMKLSRSVKKEESLSDRIDPSHQKRIDYSRVNQTFVAGEVPAATTVTLSMLDSYQEGQANRAETSILQSTLAGETRAPSPQVQSLRSSVLLHTRCIASQLDDQVQKAQFFKDENTLEARTQSRLDDLADKILAKQNQILSSATKSVAKTFKPSAHMMIATDDNPYVSSHDVKQFSLDNDQMRLRDPRALVNKQDQRTSASLILNERPDSTHNTSEEAALNGDLPSFMRRVARVHVKRKEEEKAKEESKRKLSTPKKLRNVQKFVKSLVKSEKKQERVEGVMEPNALTYQTSEPIPRQLFPQGSIKVIGSQFRRPANLNKLVSGATGDEESEFDDDFGLRSKEVISKVNIGAHDVDSSSSMSQSLGGNAALQFAANQMIFRKPAQDQKKSDRNSSRNKREV